MPMKPEAKYPPVKYISEAEIMDVYNGAYEPEDSED